MYKKYIRTYPTKGIMKVPTDSLGMALTTEKPLRVRSSSVCLRFCKKKKSNTVYMTKGDGIKLNRYHKFILKRQLRDIRKLSILCWQFLGYNRAGG